MIEREQRVLITGATSGLGREMARQLGARGTRLAITGRREERLRETEAMAREAGAADVLALHGSVTDPDVVQAHYDAIRSRYDGLDVAILNAGVGFEDTALEFTAAAYRDTFAVNVMGMCHWLEQVIPGMLAARSGLIAGVSSPAGWRGLPQIGPYSSSKAAASALLESIRVELREHGIDVVTVCPGYVKSEMTDKNDPDSMPFLMETDQGARRIISGLDRRRREVHFPWMLTLPLRFLMPVMPGFMFEPLARRMLRKVKAPVFESKASDT